MCPLNQKQVAVEADVDDAGKVVDVIVIGAGWSGLAAAKELKKNGIEAQILEGREVIGGRCRTGICQDGVTPIEYGAQWIHGVQQKNPVYQAALEAGVNMKRSDYDCQVIYQDHPDHQPTTVVTDEKLRTMEESLMTGKGGFFAYQERRQDDDDNDVSLKQCAEDYLNKIKATEEQRIWLWYLLDVGTQQEYGSSLEDMSMFWWDSDEEMKGGDVYVTEDINGGYMAILNHFAKDMTDQIHFQSKVSCIDYSSSNDNNVVVQYTQDGVAKQMVAKKVIVTVPLGVLKANVIDFCPALPKNKQRAIKTMGMGVLNKCILLWDDDVADKLPWPADKEWIERLVTGRDPKKPQGLWTEFINTQSINGRPMLHGFTVGRVAKEVEKHSDKEIKESVMKALRGMFAPHDEVPEPKEIIITRWDQDEFTYGSYSFNAIGGKHMDHKILADPVEGKLFFGGEHCHLQYFGTTHGAYMSGTNAAKHAMKALGKTAGKKGKKAANKSENKKGHMQRVFA